MDPPPLAAPGASAPGFRGAASCVLAAEGVAPFPAALALHPDDAMLRHLRRHGRGPEYACAEYVRSGLEAARCVRRTAAAVDGAAAGPWTANARREAQRKEPCVVGRRAAPQAAFLVDGRSTMRPRSRAARSAAGPR
ncbi:MAG TPA: hypothetical protein VEI02_11695 [Planctomycetota bacterium]|nr:hypothetical protein [Planctomycetota bacterium]